MLFRSFPASKILVFVLSAILRPATNLATLPAESPPTATPTRRSAQRSPTPQSEVTTRRSTKRNPASSPRATASTPSPPAPTSAGTQARASAGSGTSTQWSWKAYVHLASNEISRSRIVADSLERWVYGAQGLHEVLGHLHVDSLPLQPEHQASHHLRRRAVVRCEGCKPFRSSSRCSRLMGRFGRNTPCFVDWVAS